MKHMSASSSLTRHSWVETSHRLLGLSKSGVEVFSTADEAPRVATGTNFRAVMIGLIIRLIFVLGEIDAN